MADTQKNLNQGAIGDIDYVAGFTSGGEFRRKAPSGLPVSDATQTALDLKANTTDVDTALALKADQTDVDTALALKADAADFDQVDNTSDADKPVSTAQQAALDGKVNYSDGISVIEGIDRPGLAIDGVEVVGFDDHGRLIATLHPNTIVNLLKLQQIEGAAWSVKGSSGSIAITSGNTEAVGVLPNGLVDIPLTGRSITVGLRDGVKGVTLRDSENGDQVVVGLDGVERLGFDDQGRVLFNPAPATKVKVLDGVFPAQAIALWGTSLTARTGSAAFGYPATSVATALSAEIGVPVFNGAVGGTDSFAIAIRQGGRDFPVTLSGGQLPADTSAVALTDWGGFDAYNNQTTQYRYGSLAGIRCKLTRLSDPENVTVTTGWTVERLQAGSVVVIPDGTPFVFDDAVAYKNRIHIIEPQRNDSWATRDSIVDIRDNTLRMVDFAAHAVTDARVLIVGPWPASAEKTNPDTTEYTYAQNLRAEMKLTFGRSLVDLWDYVSASMIYDLGIPPTSDDLSDMNRGIIPRSLMDDGTHLNGAGCTGLARAYARQLLATGWLNNGTYSYL